MSKRHYACLVELCEEVANNKKLPGITVEWACDLYDLLIKPTAFVCVEDLQLLQAYGESPEYAMHLIDNSLTRRRQ